MSRHMFASVIWHCLFISRVTMKMKRLLLHMVSKQMQDKWLLNFDSQKARLYKMKDVYACGMSEMKVVLHKTNITIQNTHKHILIHTYILKML